MQNSRIIVLNLLYLILNTSLRFVFFILKRLQTDNHFNQNVPSNLLSIIPMDPKTDFNSLICLLESWDRAGHFFKILYSTPIHFVWKFEN